MTSRKVKLGLAKSKMLNMFRKGYINKSKIFTNGEIDQEKYDLFAKL